ncbi:MAG: YceD family protein [Kosmotogaceae bacterium]
MKTKIKELAVDLNSFEKTKQLGVSFENIYPEIRCDEPIDVDVFLYKEKDSVIVSGTVKTKVIEKCARCLKDVIVPINGTVEAVYLPAKKFFKEVDSGPSEDLENTLPLNSDILDLSERVLEAIIVEIPVKVLCSENCRGLCPVCGTNLNENPEHNCKQDKESKDKWHKLLNDLKENIRNG